MFELSHIRLCVARCRTSRNLDPTAGRVPVTHLVCSVPVWRARTTRAYGRSLINMSFNRREPANSFAVYTWQRREGDVQRIHVLRRPVSSGDPNTLRTSVSVTSPRAPLHRSFCPLHSCHPPTRSDTTQPSGC